MRRCFKGIVKASCDDLIARPRCFKPRQFGHVSRTCRPQASAAGRTSGGSRFGPSSFRYHDGDESAVHQEFQRPNPMTVEDAPDVLEGDGGIPGPSRTRRESWGGGIPRPSSN